MANSKKQTKILRYFTVSIVPDIISAVFILAGAFIYYYAWQIWVLATPLLLIGIAGLIVNYAFKNSEQAITDYQLPRWLVGRIFHDFSLENVSRAWQKALMLLDDTRYELDSTEDKNISVGIQQIIEIWANPANYYDSTTATIQDFEEIFRTRGEMKKALRNVSEVREAVVEEMEK